MAIFKMVDGAKVCRQMSIALCILAKDEERTIAGSLAQIANQSLLQKGGEALDVHVVANGCTDGTVHSAKANEHLFNGLRAKLRVHDLKVGGKSRAWNRAVHELLDSAANFFIFVDADIRFANDTVIEEMLTRVRADSRLSACSGYPIKNVSAKSRKSLFDRFSLIVSERTRHPGVINGSLYVARASILRNIWLPDRTPGEDGFLNAMLSTRGFSRPPDRTLITTPITPTHSFHAHGPLEFMTHERRMIVGTMVNRWIFEYLWSLHLKEPAGALIRDWNESDPEWVDRLVRERAASERWLIPNALIFRRFQGGVSQPLWKHVLYAPIALVATLVTLPPAIMANKRLKEIGAAGTW